MDLFVYFIIINSEIHLLTHREPSEPFDEEALYLNELNTNYLLQPNWEAVGMCCGIEFRDDLGSVWVYMTDKVLYDIKKAMKPEIKRVVEEAFSPKSIEFREMPPGTPGHSCTTFSRNLNGDWITRDVPVERAIFADQKLSKELGTPGGPCHIIKNIEESDIPDRVKKELTQELYSGKDLDSQDAAYIYDYRTEKYKHDLFRTIELSIHAKYRMDLRSITLDNIQEAFGEFERWFNYRKKNKHKITKSDANILQDMSEGTPVRFEANRVGLIIIFKVLSSSKVRLISTWWENKPDPRPPRGKQCSLIRSIVIRAYDKLNG